MLPEIPLIDLGEGGPVELARREKPRALALIRDTRRSYGLLSDLPSPAILRLGDRLSRAWFERARDPYLPDIEKIAKELGVPGIYALNLSYEWGCTSGVYATPEGPTLLRILDFVYDGLGRHIVAAKQCASAGEFVNFTWPGSSGIIQASAPGRFAAALNLAPMRKHRLTMAGDWLQNRRLMMKDTGMPPAHLLRKVFEEAPDYASAKTMLAQTPVCVPCIYILAGIHPGEGTVIKRLEKEAEVRDLAGFDRVAIANNFLGAFRERCKGWRPREIDSAGRQAQSEALEISRLREKHYDWVDYPMRNPMTRLILTTTPATGKWQAQGWEKTGAATALTFH